MPNSESITAWAAILGLVITVCLFFADRRAERKSEILRERRAALFEALEVVDLVDANTHFENQPTLPRKKWDITRARNAMNQILVYCEKPERTVTAFYNAIGLYVPDYGEQPRSYGTHDLNAFRNEVARELKQPAIDYLRFKTPWIFSLEGGE